MHHTVPLTSQFYVTAPQICPYLEGRMERKLFTSLQGTNSSSLNNALSKQGFRRSQNVLYRPACVACTACLSARIDVDKFFPSKSQRRILKRNANLLRRPNAPWATEKQYELFRRYLDVRHAEGGMADMDIFEFAAMIEETPVNSRVMEYNTQAGDLAAVCLTDIFDDGLSLVYSFFDTDRPKDPYLEGRMERKLFTSLQGMDSSNLNNALSKQGFRRSQNDSTGQRVWHARPAFQLVLMWTSFFPVKVIVES